MSEWAYIVHETERLREAVKEARETWRGIALLASVFAFALGIIVGAVLFAGHPNV